MTTYSPVREGGSGAIVIVASNAGLIGGGGGAAYTASKHAAIGYGRQLAANYGPRGVRTNMIAPGLIDTPMAAQVTADPAMTRSSSACPPAGPAGPRRSPRRPCSWPATTLATSTP
jgi:3-oxoacyl-[acyl-carrier protein] reductase